METGSRRLGRYFRSHKEVYDLSMSGIYNNQAVGDAIFCQTIIRVIEF